MKTFDFKKDFLIIAGPCSVESENQICRIAEQIKKAGANMLRGGVYKPRTSPYSFQGLGLEGLKYLQKASYLTELPTITEVMDTRDVQVVSEYVDVLQIGTRNMQNFALLKEVGKCRKPILLKRGMGSTIEEWLSSAEYILSEGNENVILCERGIRTFENSTRNTLDLSSVAVLKMRTHLPIIVDPSHGTGRRDLIESMSLAAIMAGCDGLEIEVHDRPDEALSDNEQQIHPNDLSRIIKKIELTLEFRDKLKETV